MSKSNVEVRPLLAADQEVWMPLWRGYQTFYKVAIADEVSAVTFARLTGGDAQMGGALAWQGGRALGLVHHIEHRSCWTVANYCYLQDLYVAEDARGTGIGRALIEYVYRLARDRGFNRVHWLTHETNLTGMQLYDRIADKTGFVQYRKMMT
jgi:GNAT superfamily N-acetyltransferase